MCMCSAFSDLFGDLINKKEDRASCPLPQNWPNQNKCSCSEEIRLDAELEAAINGFHFIFVVAANIKFVQSKMLGFFFFRMVKFSLGIWHHAPDCDGNFLFSLIPEHQIAHELGCFSAPCGDASSLLACGMATSKEFSFLSALSFRLEATLDD